MSELRYDDRVIVITGAGRGLGRAYAELLGARGARVVVNDPGSAVRGEGIDAGPAAEVVAAIKAQGGDAIVSTDSVATPEGGRAIIEAALDHYGRIDGLIHNAGNVRYGSMQALSQEDFDAVLDVHLRGAFHVARAAFPHMCKARYGRIVLTSSIGGLYGNRDCVNYGMSKSGMIGLNNVLALEGEAEGVKSNIIVPGAVTRMAEGLDISQYPPMGPELVSPVVAWLAHESCSVTGEMLVSIAGRVARAFIAESKGVYQPSWTPEDVGARIDAIMDSQDPLVFGLEGHVDHIRYSFGRAVAGE
ncbi:SDR family NAD(P)-dependent oxidoreductase [Sphingobium yanoikuyae]|uniref:SDR family NAD(P)-dependent oxidoreductase n=1 Tax=Sphingobium yanoikuyae TaxID=13690 RepID=A0A085K5L7_SPHYA|nr:SDR family NAD(P)-dependent oxidoreductase [Sphingobium yanoikuyae]AYO79374.1 SDR family NAD(P)-dependent oxidoreductase [Sphingobium yanoikuyae]KFD28013.1 short-chain dehydrogenase [Sphingobium yanoikuyae]KZC76916.1 short-chain dehydrogenase [Sphingobium yanoikuyae]MDV3480958.1 SDR family NAD(P)-dependent oxidoreductase [Sphingobium yanoikuyae]